MMIAAPVMQLIMLTYAANFEVKNINLTVVDEDHTTFSQRLISKFTSIPNFHLIDNAPSYKQAYKKMLDGKTDLILVIPPILIGD
jgi:ABC-2 type transport system permease protein